MEGDLPGARGIRATSERQRKKILKHVAVKNDTHDPCETTRC